MKKLNIFLLLAVLCLMLTGCDIGKPTIELTEDESNAIAQYCAHLLMKYGAKDLYRERGEKLLDKKDLKDAVEERKAENKPSPTPSPTPTPDVDKPADNDDRNDPDDPSKDITSTPAPTFVNTVEDASVLFDPSRFEITVSKPAFTKKYLGENEAYAISAHEDELIVMFTINVKNITSEDQIFYYQQFINVTLQLIVDETKSVAPEMSLLDKDFIYTQANLKPGETFPGVILFIVDDRSTDFTFRIIGDEQKAYEINLYKSAEVENGN